MTPTLLARAGLLALAVVAMSGCPAQPAAPATTAAAPPALSLDRKFEDPLPV